MISSVNRVSTKIAFGDSDFTARRIARAAESEASTARAEVRTLSTKFDQMESKLNKLIDTVELLSKPITFGPG